jgi:hypothetical protein
MSNTHKTNAEIITEIMDYSRAGALAQLFVIEAIRKYAEQVSANPEKVHEAMQGGFIHPDAWVETAEIIKQELSAAYGE